MKKIDPLKAVSLLLLVSVVGIGTYLFVAVASPTTEELTNLSTGIEPLPDISFSSPAFSALDVRQKFGPVPLQLSGSDLGRPQPFSEP